MASAKSILSPDVEADDKRLVVWAARYAKRMIVILAEIKSPRDLEVAREESKTMYAKLARRAKVIEGED